MNKFSSFKIPLNFLLSLIVIISLQQYSIALCTVDFPGLHNIKLALSNGDLPVSYDDDTYEDEREQKSREEIIGEFKEKNKGKLGMLLIFAILLKYKWIILILIIITFFIIKKALNNR